MESKSLLQRKTSTTNYATTTHGRQNNTMGDKTSVYIRTNSEQLSTENHTTIHGGTAIIAAVAATTTTLPQLTTSADATTNASSATTFMANFRAPRISLPKLD